MKNLKKTKKGAIIKPLNSPALTQVEAGVFLYIDGTNLFIGLIDLFGLNNIPAFKSILREINKITPVDRIFFYASFTPPSNKKYKNTIITEARFYKEVISTPNLVFFKGHRSPSSGKEKGVDVHLAVDIIKNAFQKSYNHAIIMTGDADLVYAVEIVRTMNIRIDAIFLPNRFSKGIAHTANNATVLNYNNYFIPISSEKLPKQLIVKKIKTPNASKRGRLNK